MMAIFGSSGNGTPAVISSQSNKQGVSLLSVDRVKRTGVEIALKIFFASISKSVKSAMDLFQQFIPGQLATPMASMRANWTAKCFNSTRCQVAFVLNEFKDGIVRWNHPLCPHAHIVVFSIHGVHRDIGIATHPTYSILNLI